MIKNYDKQKQISRSKGNVQLSDGEALSRGAQAVAEAWGVVSGNTRNGHGVRRFSFLRGRKTVPCSVVETVKSVSEQGLLRYQEQGSHGKAANWTSQSVYFFLQNANWSQTVQTQKQSKSPVGERVRGRNTKPTRSVLDRGISPKPSWRKDPVLNHTIAVQGTSSWSKVQWHTDKKRLLHQ